jgi:parvulin-like peptidyl-prolyl isomerase
LAKKKGAEKPQRQLTRRQLSQHQKQQRRQRIVFISGITVVAVVVLLIIFGWLMGEYMPLRATVIKVGEHEYSMGYYIDRIKYEAEMRQSEDIASIASYAISNIENAALFMKGAEGLGITVSNDEAREALETAGAEVDDITIDDKKLEILSQRVVEEYITPLFPVSDNQVNINVMFLENESRALEVRDKLLNSGNFTALVEEYSLDANTRDQKGQVGWHTIEMLDVWLGTSVPGSFAAGAEIGEISPPLYDDAVSKPFGYWLINVLEKTPEEEATIQGILLGSKEEALEVRSRIETTDNLTALIQEVSQHTSSKSMDGKIGPIVRGDMNNQAIDDYVFDENVEFGVWSEPIIEVNIATKGGYWLVEVVDKDEDHAVSEMDINYQVNEFYSNWVSSLKTQWEAVVDHSYLTPERVQWAVDKVRASLNLPKG